MRMHGQPSPPSCPGSCFSKYLASRRFTQRVGKHGPIATPTWPSIFRAMEECMQTRASPRSSAALERSSQRSETSMKCEIWLTCICGSYLSAVGSSRKCITPALQHNTSRPSLPPPRLDFTLTAAAFTDSSDVRSQSTCRAFAPASVSSLTAASARDEGRLRQKIRAPFFAATLASTSPVPLVHPVIATVLPFKSGRDSMRVLKGPSRFLVSV